MFKLKFPKLSKFQTTKLIIFVILTVWVVCTAYILAILTFKSQLVESRISDIMSIYGHVTLAMNTGVIGYMLKSTYENQNKYGKLPYGKETPNETQEL